MGTGILGSAGIELFSTSSQSKASAGARYRQRMAPPLPTGLFPGILISGSSPAGLAAAKAIGATAVKYPTPADQLGEEPPDEGIGTWMRIGIIARQTAQAAWTVARQRFPEDLPTEDFDNTAICCAYARTDGAGASHLRRELRRLLPSRRIPGALDDGRRRGRPDPSPDEPELDDA